MPEKNQEKRVTEVYKVISLNDRVRQANAAGILSVLKSPHKANPLVAVDQKKAAFDEFLSKDIPGVNSAGDWVLKALARLMGRSEFTGPTVTRYATYLKNYIKRLENVDKESSVVISNPLSEQGKRKAYNVFVRLINDIMECYGRKGNVESPPQVTEGELRTQFDTALSLIHTDLTVSHLAEYISDASNEPIALSKETKQRPNSKKAGSKQSKNVVTRKSTGQIGALKTSPSRLTGLRGDCAAAVKRIQYVKLGQLEGKELTSVWMQLNSSSGLTGRQQSLRQLFKVIYDVHPLENFLDKVQGDKVVIGSLLNEIGIDDVRGLTVGAVRKKLINTLVPHCNDNQFTAESLLEIGFSGLLPCFEESEIPADTESKSRRQSSRPSRQTEFLGMRMEYESESDSEDTVYVPLPKEKRGAKRKSSDVRHEGTVQKVVKQMTPFSSGDFSLSDNPKERYDYLLRHLDEIEDAPELFEMKTKEYVVSTYFFLLRTHAAKWDIPGFSKTYVPYDTFYAEATQYWKEQKTGNYTDSFCEGIMNCVSDVVERKLMGASVSSFLDGGSEPGGVEIDSTPFDTMISRLPESYNNLTQETFEKLERLCLTTLIDY